ncbi:MAG TPA: hypothetical protein VN549_03405, partial [Negativicutes bacterium]|nr:hypothetical protein [Negativicutes bacterium]
IMVLALTQGVFASIPVLAELTPQNIEAASYSPTSVKITWDQNADLTGCKVAYYIYRQNNEGNYQMIGNTENEYYIDTGRISWKTYRYKVRTIVSALSAAGTYYEIIKTSPQSGEVSATPAVSVPSNFTVTTTSSTCTILKWDSVEGATSYMVYRSDSEKGTYTLIARASGPKHVDMGLTSGNTYYYKIRTYIDSSSSIWSSNTNLSSLSSAYTDVVPIVASYAGSSSGNNGPPARLN